MGSTLESSSDDEVVDILNIEDDEGWDDVESDVEKVEVVSLFDDIVFGDVLSMLQYCKKAYKFDLAKVQKDLKLELLEMVKLVNYIRSETREGRRSLDVSTKAIFEDDSYLKPVLDDDPLLYSLEDAIANDGPSPKVLDDGGVFVVPSQTTALKPEKFASKVREYEEQLAATRDTLQASAKQLDLTERALEQSNICADSLRQQLEVSSVGSRAATVANESGYSDNGDCYSDIPIHRHMLQDKIRTESYRDFLLGNKHLFEGKTVLDVGCGTGILSMFCAQAGAKQVFAVERSSIYEKAQKIVFDNGFQSIIKILHGRIEEIHLPVPKVDIIVSEWMGYALLFEGMLDSVIWARDRYLTPNGLMIPAYTTLHIAPMANRDYVAERIGFWNTVYDFDMTAMSEDIEKTVDIYTVPDKCLCGSSPSPFIELSMYTATIKDLEFDIPFECIVNEKVSEGIDGFVIWFDTFFSAASESQISLHNPGSQEVEDGKEGRDAHELHTFLKAQEGNVAFTTGPSGEPTHWEQAVLLFDRKVKKPRDLKAGDCLNGKVRYKKGTEAGSLEIRVEWETDGGRVEQQTWALK